MIDCPLVAPVCLREFDIDFSIKKWAPCLGAPFAIKKRKIRAWQCDESAQFNPAKSGFQSNLPLD
jgi:hypothetical protein